MEPTTQEKIVHNHPEGCRCSGCMGYGMRGQFGHRFWLLRLLIGLVILLVVFWLGVKTGELKSALRGGYPMMRQYPMMRNQYYLNQNPGGNIPPMMQYQNGTTTQQ